MTTARLDLRRLQILAFRRHAGGPGHAVLQPCPGGAAKRPPPPCKPLAEAALLSIHARVEGTEPSTWEDPSLVQLWGPRFNVFLVAARDLAVFSLGTLPDDARGRPEDLAAASALSSAAQSAERRSMGVEMPWFAMGHGPACGYVLTLIFGTEHTSTWVA